MTIPTPTSASFGMSDTSGTSRFQPKALTYSHLQAVIFDWAGTTIDHGSLAPMAAFVQAFDTFGITLSIDQARGPMGMAKRAHIKALLALPSVWEAWVAQHGDAPSEADIDAIYEVFLPLNLAALADHAELIEGVTEIVSALRVGGMKIGSTTGYVPEIMARLVPEAARQGYTVDSLVCTGDTAQGRPSPLMIYRNLLDLEVWPAWSAVKVDDTEVGIAEGLNAGCWSVGVALTGNLFGLSPSQTRALSEDEYAQRRAHAYARLSAAGAHYVIDSVAQLAPVLAQIDGRLARGERP